MSDKHPYLSAATDATARAPLGRTISGLIMENLTECHIVLNALGIPPAPDGFSLDGALAFRLKLWLAGQPADKEIDNER